MRILWHNIFAVILAFFIAALLAKHGSAIHRFLSSMQGIGPDHDPDERTLGLIAFGLVAISLVAIVRLLIRNGK